MSACMKEVLIEEEGLNKQGVWIGRCRGFFDVAIPLGDVSGRYETLE